MVSARRALILALAAVAAASGAACSVLVAPDESRLVPPDAGAKWCDGPLTAPVIEFPRDTSGVLGYVPVWGTAADCSGVAAVRLEALRDDQLVDGGVISTTLEDEAFTGFWDTTSFAQDRKALELKAITQPRRPGVEPAPATIKVEPFTLVPLRPPSEVPSGFYFVDLDGDGDLDLIWGGRVLRNDGAWPFTDVTASAFGDYCGAYPARCDANGHLTVTVMAVADLNGDSRMDLVLWCGGPLELAAGGPTSDGNGWQLADPASTPSVQLANLGVGGDWSLTVTDLNLDGWLDVVAVNRCVGPGASGCSIGHPSVLLMASPGAPPTWSPRNGVLEPSYYDRSVTAGDLNGDGWPDLVVGRELGAPALIYLNDGPGANGTLTAQAPSFHLPSTFPVQLADYDRDGQLDMVFPRFGGLALWRNGGGAAPVFDDVTELVGYPGGILADINNDGFLDAGAALGSPRQLFVQTGVAAFGLPIDVGFNRANPRVDFVTFGSDIAVSSSTLIGTARIVARVNAPTLLPGNHFGIGTRVQVTEHGADPAAPGPWGVSTAEIGPLWSGALAGYEAQFGVTADRTYDLHYLLPTPGGPTSTLCQGDGDQGILPNSVCTLDTDLGCTCQ